MLKMHISTKMEFVFQLIHTVQLHQMDNVFLVIQDISSKITIVPLITQPSMLEMHYVPDGQEWCVNHVPRELSTDLEFALQLIPFVTLGITTMGSV